MYIDLHFLLQKHHVKPIIKNLYSRPVDQKETFKNTINEINGLNTI